MSTLRRKSGGCCLEQYGRSRSGGIGPERQPVMEGKGVLFKIFADIGVFDLELDAADPDSLLILQKPLRQLLAASICGHQGT